MTTNMNEMEVYMMTKPALATNTKKTYHKNYSNLLKLLGSDDVHSIDPQEIIRDVKTIANPNTQNMYITISIMLKAFFGKSTSQLLKHRDLIKENIKTRKNKNKDMKKDEKDKKAHGGGEALGVPIHHIFNDTRWPQTTSTDGTVLDVHVEVDCDNA